MTTLFIDKQLFNHRTDVRLIMSHPEYADNSAQQINSVYLPLKTLEVSNCQHIDTYMI